MLPRLRRSAISQVLACGDSLTMPPHERETRRTLSSATRDESF